MLRRFTPAVLFALIITTVLFIGTSFGLPAGQDADQSAIQEAANWIRRENKIETAYGYVMTCKVRLLFFWAGRDDVGGGYVRIGKADDDEREQMIQVLFGSDPAKAPLSINRWGAGTEVLRISDSAQPAAGAFFGFMKSSKGQSVMAMQKELSKEKSNGEHLFDGIMSRVDVGRALTTTVPFTSNTDFTKDQYAEAEKATLQQLADNPSRKVRRLDGADLLGCPRVGGFLSTTRELIDAALADRPTPISLCYIYNARHYTATLLNAHPVADKIVHVTLRGKDGSFDRSYHHLKEAHMEVVGRDSGSKSSFDILIGTEGNLRGAPVQIIYQPNWWFQIILNMAPDSPQPAGT